MSFKDNLLKKIKIDSMADAVVASIGTPGTEYKIDKKTMRSLLDMSPYKLRKERDLDLYIDESDSEIKKILVLDNDLPIFRSTIEDVAMRKSPWLKEMISIRNVIKILNDKDVVISRKADSVREIQKECISGIDLSYQLSDIEEIENQGRASLENGYEDGVIETLSLFAELLKFALPPREFKIAHHEMIGSVEEKETGELLYGQIVMYSMIHNTLKLMKDKIGSFNKAGIEYLHKVATGKEKADIEGADVFGYLKDKIYER